MVSSAENLPLVVARYLRVAVLDPRPIRSVRLRQTGRLRADLSRDRWMRFEAEHVVTVAPPAFEWNARVRVAPLVTLHVRDAYRAGQGSGRVSLFSLPLSRAADTPEMNAGSLHRYLAEAVWYPTLLAASEHLRWTSPSDRVAVATLTDHDTTVSLEFRFSTTGEVEGIYTPARWGRFGRVYSQRAWEGHFRDYDLVDGIRIPTTADVGWYVDGQWEPVWIGTVRDFTVTRFP